MRSSTFSTLPLDLFEWISHTSVMTEKLRQQVGPVEMEILTHDWTSPNHWEHEVLKQNALLLRRDVLIKAKGSICWFARTMIPITTYQLAPSFFDRLHQEPLAHLIFNEPRVTRDLLHSYGINQHHLEYDCLGKHKPDVDSDLWMRLSMFTFQQSSTFYLAEVYYPAMHVVWKKAHDDGHLQVDAAKALS